MELVYSFLEMLRVKQWAKNLLVFFPALMFPFALDLGNAVSLSITAALFCVSASMVYIVNDWSDRHSDANHHTKKDRPFASARLGFSHAFLGFLLLTVIFILLCFKVSESSPLIVMLMLTYLAQSFLYSWFLKNVTLLEMLIVSTGYSYRVLAGGLSVDLRPSAWMLATIFLASIFMISQKRLSDIKTSGDVKNIRPSMQLYPDGFLNMTTMISASAAIVSFLLFTLSDYAVDKFSNPYLPMTSLFVVYATFRYLQVTMQSHKGHDPVQLIIRDSHLRVCVFLCLVFIILTNGV